MAWVRWSRICVNKARGGLGIRNMELFNLSLLGKWRWRLKVEKGGAWALLLHRLYGEGGLLNSKQASVWWKDIQKIDDGNSVSQGWLEDNIKVKVGDGRTLKFWTDSWCGPNKLKEVFPELFRIAGDQQCTIADAESGVHSSRRWSLIWTRNLTSMEKEEADLLHELLLPFCLDNNAADQWLWLKDNSKIYKVKYAYDHLLSCCNDVESDEYRIDILKQLWKSAAPSKFLVLAWRIFAGGMPTRVELKHRGVLGPDQSIECVMCNGAEEDISHLFLQCNVAAQLWQQVFDWCGVEQFCSSNPWDHFVRNSVIFKHKQRSKLRHLVWLAAVWVLWLTRNSVVFRGSRFNINRMVHNVKCLVWGWFVHKVDLNSTITIENWCNGTLRELI